ncbi:hypothetical protein KUW00_05665 [Halomonas sp. DP5N14-9]|uniref:hypothetical protein n=1 Tax=Halomonas sp. DP5N14-9 TaxID=2859075 RepID=UPI001C99B397|nr:hypothetical protein [Halomonas sp. DP5N14-9]MBY5940373.1 hypothetical protein [Halomonas sp. DP5N14-9]
MYAFSFEVEMSGESSKNSGQSAACKRKPVWRQAGESSWIGSVVVGGSALIGLMIAFYQDKISNAFPFPMLEGDFSFSNELSFQACFFWLFFIVTVSLAWLKEKARKQSSEEVNNELSGKISEVRMLSLTMPPKDYMRVYGELYTASVDEFDNLNFGIEKSLEDGAESTSDWREQTNAVIRVVLDAILQLSIVFDSPNNEFKSKYFAGISWLVQKEELDVSDVSEIWEYAKRVSRHENIEGFISSTDLFLVDDVHLTTESNNDAAPIGEVFSPIIWGWEADYNFRQGIIVPGPLQALVADDFSRVQCSSKCAENLVEFGEGAVESLEVFFAGDPIRSSFISFRIEGNIRSSEEKLCIATLSIYRDSPGVLENDDRARMFYRQIIPFLNMLFRLLMIRLEIDASDGRELRLYTESGSGPSKED